MTESGKEHLANGLAAALRVPISTGGDAALTAVTRDQRVEDIAEAMGDISYNESLAVFNWLPNDTAAGVLSHVEADTQRFLIDHAPPQRIAQMLDHLPMDDAADVVSEASPERAEELLSELSQSAPLDAAEVRELLNYGEATAGRLMTDKFVRLSDELSVEEAFAVVRRAHPDVETMSDLYVVDRPDTQHEKLLGVLSLRSLVVARSDELIGDLMTRDLVTATVDTDQQEVARLIAKYDFLAIPILDRGGALAGIVTVDDIIDVMVEEFSEDIMRFVGSDAEVMDRKTPVQIARLRLPWLLATMVIELMAGVVISHFDYVLIQVVLLASFMPVISAISGNVGLQAAAVIVRGLDTGHVTSRGWGRALSRETTSSFIMAMVCGLILGTIGALWAHRLVFGVVIGIGMTCSMMTASVMGTLIPMLSKRFGFDPATTAGPFETSFQDLVGYGVFLYLASLLLPYLK